jgi:hypothetical protein
MAQQHKALLENREGEGEGDEEIVRLGVVDGEMES